MKQKPITPYKRLLDDVREFCRKIKYRHTKSMWLYPKEKLDEQWRLDGLYERVCAAEQLGYDVVLVGKEDGLHVNYVKKAPDTPWRWG